MTLHTLFSLWLVTTAVPPVIYSENGCQLGAARWAQRKRRRGWVALADLLLLVPMCVRWLHECEHLIARSVTRAQVPTQRAAAHLFKDALCENINMCVERVL